jgi:tetratricopeptide (TPR) repeat protein
MAVTGSDLYCIDATSPQIDHAVYQPSEGSRFVDTMLAGADKRRTFALLSTTLRGGVYTLSTAEYSPEMETLWSHDFTGATAISVSSDGEFFAVGLNTGGVTLLSRTGEMIWQYHSSLASSASNAISSLSVDHTGTVLSVNGSSLVHKHEAKTGKILWKQTLPLLTQSLSKNGSSAIFDLASDRLSDVIAVTGYCYNDGDNAASQYAILNGSDGFIVWQDSLDSIPSGVAVSNNGDHICVSTLSGDLYKFDTQLSRHISSFAVPHKVAMAQTLFEEAQTALSAGQVGEATPLLGQVLSLNPIHISAVLLYEEATWRLREETLASTTNVSEKSLEAVEQALKSMPYDEKLTVRRNALARLLSEQYASQAAEFVSQSREEEAIDLLYKAIAYDSLNVDLRNALKTVQDRFVTRLSEESQSMLARQMYQEAMINLQKISVIRPDEPGIMQRLNYVQTALAFNMGMRHMNAGRHVLARFQFKKTIILDPSHPDAGRYLHQCEQAIAQASSQSSGR